MDEIKPAIYCSACATAHNLPHRELLTIATCSLCGGSHMCFVPSSPVTPKYTDPIGHEADELGPRTIKHAVSRSTVVADNEQADTTHKRVATNVLGKLIKGETRWKHKKNATAPTAPAGTTTATTTTTATGTKTQQPKPSQKQQKPR